MGMKKMKIKINIWILAILAGFVFSSFFSATHAATITLTADDDFRGTFNSSESGLATKVIGNSFQVRTIGSGGVNIQVSHNYHLFNLPMLGLGETIIGADLIIPYGGYDSPDPTETVTLYDVSTPGVTLRDPANNPLNLSRDTIFDDLGSGMVFGNLIATPSLSNPQTISLNGNALSALNTAVGGEWAIGGAVTTGTHTCGTATVPTCFFVWERVWRGFSATQPPSELVLTTAVTPVVPIPASVWLFGSGVVGLVGIARRKRPAHNFNI